MSMNEHSTTSDSIHVLIGIDSLRKFQFFLLVLEKEMTLLHSLLNCSQLLALCFSTYKMAKDTASEESVSAKHKGGSGWGVTNVSCQLKYWPFVSYQLNFMLFVSCQLIGY